MAKTITSDLVTLSLCDTNTNWRDITITGFGVNTDAQVQGTGCLNGKISNGNGYAAYAPSPSLNFSTGSNHLRMWCKIVAWPATQTTANSGLGFFIGSNTSTGIPLTGIYPQNSRMYNVGGSDKNRTEGWIDYVVSPRVACDVTTGTANMAAITRIGFIHRTTKLVSIANIFIDALRYGTGLTSTGGTHDDPLDMEDIYITDATPANAWGFVKKEYGEYYISGKLNIGAASQTQETHAHIYDDDMIFRCFPVDPTYYEINIAQSASYPTVVAFGQKDGDTISNGAFVFSEFCPLTDVPAYWTLNVNNDSTFKAYGSSFWEAKEVNLSNKSELSYCLFDRCGAVHANDATIEYTRFSNVAEQSPVDGTAALIIDSTSELSKITTCSFINNKYALKITTPGIYTCNDNYFAGNDYDIQNSSGGDVTINAINDSNPSTYINTSGGTTTIKHMHTLTLEDIETDSTGALIAIYAHDTTTELAVAFDVTTGTYSYTYDYAANTYVDIVVISLGYIIERIDGFLLPNADTSIPIEQVLDRQYENPA